MRTIARLFLAVSAIACFGPTLRASFIVYDNFGPGDAYSTSQCAGVGNSSLGTYAFACPFRASDSGNLDELWLGITSSYPAETLKLSLTENLNFFGDWTPGASLWSTTISDRLGANGSGAVLHLDHLDGPMLEDGVDYWITAEGTSTPNCAHSWWTNVIGQRGEAEKHGEGSWMSHINSPALAMRVSVVPEPSVLALFLFGFFGFLAWKWRHNRNAI